MYLIKNTLIFRVAVILAGIMILSCGGPEEKKMKFFNKGKALYEQGDYAKAALEFKNAVQIDPKFADAYYMLGMIELKKGNWKQAFGMFSKTVDLDPANLDAQAQLGTLLLAARQTDQALEKAALVLEKDPHHIDALMLKAAALLAQGKNDPCQAALTQIFAADPNRPEAFRLQAQVRLAQKDKKGAEEILKRGIGAAPESIPLRLSLAQFYIRENRLYDAEAVYQELITLKPDVLSYKKILASFYAGSGQPDKAEKTLQEIIDADPANPGRRIVMAQFLVAHKRADEAERVLKDAVTQEPDGTTALFALGSFYVEQDRPDQALLIYQKIVDKYDKAPEALRAKDEMARVYFAQKDYKKAENLINSVLERNPGDLQAHSLLGELALVRGDGPKAVSEFRTVVQANPNSARAYFSLARGHALNNEQELAKDNLKKALTLNPNLVEARRLLAKVHLRQRSYQEAEAELKTVLETHRENLTALADLGDACVLQGKAKEAATYYEKIIILSPEDPLGHFKLGVLRMRDRNYARAVEHFDRALYFAPDRKDIFTAQIRALLSMGKTAEAISRCTNAVAGTPDDASLHNLLGEVYLIQKGYQKAIDAFNKAIDLAPTSFRPYTNLARTYTMQGKTAEAIRNIEERVHANPENARLAFFLGVLWETENDIPKATTYYRQAVNADPEFIVALNNLAFLIAEGEASGKDMDEALNMARKAVGRFPNHPSIADTLGWIYYQRAEYELAYGQFHKLLDQGADNPVFNYHMGMVLYKQGRMAEAREYLEKALERPAKYVDREKIEEVLKELS